MRYLFLRVLLLMLPLFWLAGCSPVNPPLAKAPPVTVSVSLPLQKEVTDSHEYLATIDSVQSVDLKARVTGYLMETKFKDGAEVKKGEVLFVIDKRTYEVDLKKSIADIKSAQATLQYNKRDVARIERALNSGAVSREDYDKAVSAVAVAEANLDVAKSAKERAELNLNWCEVKSPIDGTVSRELITVGNLVQADQTTLTTIVTRDPVYVYFDIDERRVQRYLQSVGDDRHDPTTGQLYPIYLGLDDDVGFPHKGSINFIDNRLSATTGAIQIRGVFYRKDITRELVPGFSARVRVPEPKGYLAILVPDKAIGTDQGDKFLFVVNAENKVEYRKVVIGTLHDGMRVITQGITPKDHVIVNGLQRVRQGATVDTQMVDIITEIPTEKPSEAK